MSEGADEETDIRDRIDTIELADGRWLEDRFDGTFLCRREGGTLFSGEGEITRVPCGPDIEVAWEEAEARIAAEQRADKLEAEPLKVVRKIKAMLDEEGAAELRGACALAMALGYATGHADTHEQLLDCVLKQAAGDRVRGAEAMNTPLSPDERRHYVDEISRIDPSPLLKRLWEAYVALEAGLAGCARETGINADEYDGVPDCELTTVAPKLVKCLKQDFDDTESDALKLQAERRLWQAVARAAEGLRQFADVLLRGFSSSYCECCDRHAPKDDLGRIAGPIPHKMGCELEAARLSLDAARAAGLTWEEKPNDAP